MNKGDCRELEGRYLREILDCADNIYESYTRKPTFFSKIASLFSKEPEDGRTLANACKQVFEARLKLI